MALTLETQAKIDRAFSDKDTAETADKTHIDAVDDLTLAIKAESDTASAALTAHQVATQSAHDALAAIAAELGFPLPS